MDPMSKASTSVLCLHYRPEAVHCSTKDVYTSEITFLALHPWYEPAEQCAYDTTSKKTTWFEFVYFREYEPAKQCAYDTTLKKNYMIWICVF